MGWESNTFWTGSSSKTSYKQCGPGEEANAEKDINISAGELQQCGLKKKRGKKCFR